MRKTRMAGAPASPPRSRAAPPEALGLASACAAAARCTRPRGLIREPFGKKNCAIFSPSALRSERSVGPRLGRDGLHVIGQRIQMHRPIIEAGMSCAVDPNERVLEPVLVVAR